MSDPVVQEARDAMANAALSRIGHLVARGMGTFRYRDPA
jgi:hypothetical protein